MAGMAVILCRATVLRGYNRYHSELGGNPVGLGRLRVVVYGCLLAVGIWDQRQRGRIWGIER